MVTYCDSTAVSVYVNDLTSRDIPGICRSFYDGTVRFSDERLLINAAAFLWQFERPSETWTAPWTYPFPDEVLIFM